MRKQLLMYLSLYGVLILATLPLAAGWVPPNRWYGFRFPGAQVSPEAWYRINTLGGQLFIAGTLACAGITVLAMQFSNKTVRDYLPWISAALIFINFWLVTTELVSRLP
jgi:hypothetical protein